MRILTLVTERSYFGLDALRLRAAANRVLLRVVGLPIDRALVSRTGMAQDFGMTTTSGQALVDEMMGGGLLRAHTQMPGDLRLTTRFLQVATARVVDPLPRERAQALVARLTTLAERINAERSRNPYEIESMAVCGSYMSRDRTLSDLALGVVLRPRAPGRLARWGHIEDQAKGRKEIRGTLEKPSTFIQVRFVKNHSELPRPFSVLFRADP
jgi:hypothetical protein